MRDDATLRVASASTARVVLAVTSDDITNLQAAAAHLEAEGELRLLALFPQNPRHAASERAFTVSEQLMVVATEAGLPRVVEGSLES